MFDAASAEIRNGQRKRTQQQPCINPCGKKSTISAAFVYTFSVFYTSNRCLDLMLGGDAFRLVHSTRIDMYYALIKRNSQTTLRMRTKAADGHLMQELHHSLRALPAWAGHKNKGKIQESEEPPALFIILYWEELRICHADF